MDKDDLIEGQTGTLEKPYSYFLCSCYEFFCFPAAWEVRC